MLENALLALLPRYLENYWTEFHHTFSIYAFLDMDEYVVSVWVKRLKVKVTTWPRVSERRHIELHAVRRVLISNFQL